ncbi:MAG: type II toxin-antitoxin system VapC family toxin [Gemmatimonadetes bacterium]|nr:type II toxin-antitoxin system VapC family toxin [Gemmatimonadota bacterium]
MNVVDSSGWIEYLVNSPNAEFFKPAIEDAERLVVPTISVAEVFRWVFREAGKTDALQVTALMQEGHVVGLDVPLAMRAASMGFTLKLPLADSVIFATARAYGATLWTQDAHFENIAGVQYRPKRRS